MGPRPPVAALLERVDVTVVVAIAVHVSTTGGARILFNEHLTTRAPFQLNLCGLGTVRKRKVPWPRWW